MAIIQKNGELDAVRLYDLAMVASGDMTLEQLGEYDMEDLAHLRSIRQDFRELRESHGCLRPRRRMLPVTPQRVPIAVRA